MKTSCASFLAVTISTACHGQVTVGSFLKSEFFPNRTELENQRTVSGTFGPTGFHYTVNKKLRVGALTGPGYAIHGDVQHFRVGSQPTIASSIRMRWAGSHQTLFDNALAEAVTPLSVDVRLVRFDDLNQNGEWNAGEQQWDLTPSLLLSDSLINSVTKNVEGERSFAGPAFLEANSSYFFGGSVSYNLSNSVLEAHTYRHDGIQEFDVTFAPVPEPSTLAPFVLGSLALLKRRR